MNSHAVDGVALACSEFIDYVPIILSEGKGKEWKGEVTVTKAPFAVVKRPPFCKRQLHLTVPAKGGVRRKQGGSTTSFGLRKGDLVRTPRGLGYVSGETGNKVSISDRSWKRVGKVVASKVKLVRCSSNLVTVKM